MTTCRACNKSYKIQMVVDDNDGTTMDTEEIGEETIFCPFCGEDHRYHQQSYVGHEWQATFDNR